MIFHQIGHNSINLVSEEKLHRLGGMVCSPLNYSESELYTQIKGLPKSFISIFDPQLYFPRSERGKLRSWNYFPSDFESADQSNLAWWGKICNNIIETCMKLGCSHICSPCIVPTKFTTEYYKFSVEIGNYLFDRVKKSGFGFFQTAIIDFKSIKEPGEAEIIASVLSQTYGKSIYLIITTDLEPRRELSDIDSIASVMKLIRLLTDTDIDVFIGFCSSEFVLWKYAGAKNFSTGKYFNLRRFTCSRFEEPSGGGGQLPYWFENNLMAYLREGDLVRIIKKDLLNNNYVNNPFSIEIIEQLKEMPGTAWLGLSWKNYLYSFAELDYMLESKEKIANLLVAAEKKWQLLEDNNVLMEEIRNDGSWIRSWRIAINKFDDSFI